MSYNTLYIVAIHIKVKMFHIHQTHICIYCDVEDLSELSCSYLLSVL